MKVKKTGSIEDRIRTMIRRTVDVLMQDAHTCEPPITNEEAVLMSPDYFYIHGDDDEAADAFGKLPAGNQTSILNQEAARFR